MKNAFDRVPREITMNSRQTFEALRYINKVAEWIKRMVRKPDDPEHKEVIHLCFANGPV